jgi:ABC-type microcin C transport system permease subunit YejE
MFSLIKRGLDKAAGIVMGGITGLVGGAILMVMQMEPGVWQTAVNLLFFITIPIW